MKADFGLLISALRTPQSLISFPLAQWDLLIRQARHAGLLARLHCLLEEYGLLREIPTRPRNHLESARVLADRQVRAVRWETACIQRALADIDTPVIFLKGAAYVVADLPPARGRLFADIDIMVPKSSLEAVEKALFRQGWVTTKLNAYDQRYYRKWMHELPPLHHIKRKTTLDVHHTILPETARLHPDPQKLLDAAVPVGDSSKLQVLAPLDMILHSATHLFHDGELENGLRDLADLDDLLRHFSDKDNFWSELVERAGELDLMRPLYYALRYTSTILGTPVPESALQAAQAGKPMTGMASIMDTLFTRGLAPDHPSCDDRFTGISRWLLYVRSHYLRMPLHLLLPHLARKALRPSQAN